MAELTNRWHLRFLLAGMMLLLMVGFAGAQQLQQSDIKAQQEQRMADDRLANQLYRDQEWDKAGAIYYRLFKAYRSKHYFGLYVDCLIQAKRFDDAESAVKEQMKINGSGSDFEVDLGYIYLLQGQEKKATRIFERVLKDLPAERNSIYITANAFRSRGLNEYAMQVYDFGSQQSSIQYGFHLEKALLYQTMGDFSSAIDQYLRQVEAQPEQLELIKSRLQYLLLLDIDQSMANLLREKLLKKAQENPDNENYGALLIWFALQQNDFDIAMIQARALDRRFGDREIQILDLAAISANNQQFEVALQGYQYIVDKGKNSPNVISATVGLLQAKYLIAKKNNVADEAYYRSLAKEIETSFEQFGLNTEDFGLALTLAQIQAFELGQTAEAIAMAERALQLPLSPIDQAQVKLQLADIYLFGNEVWEATLLYSQIEKSLKDEPIAHEARFRNARLRYLIGEFGWAQMQLNVLKAATSKLIANDALSLALQISDIMAEDTTGNTLKVLANADLLLYRHQDQQAAILLDSLRKTNRNQVVAPYVLMREASIAVLQQQYAKADSLYTRVFTVYADSYQADDALMKSALLNEVNLQNRQLASERYQLLIDKYPSSVFVAEARRKYRMLRGDQF